MELVLRQTVIVQEGGLIEVRSPELMAGTRAEILILPQAPAIDVSDTWSDEDIRDLTAANDAYILRRLEEEENA